MYATSRHPRGEGIPAPTRSVARAIAICLLAAWILFARREAAAQQFVFRHYQERESIGNLSPPETGFWFAYRGPVTRPLVGDRRWAGSQFLGRPYDLTFDWSHDRMYCSELVYKVYDRALGIKIGDL